MLIYILYISHEFHKWVHYPGCYIILTTVAASVVTHFTTLLRWQKWMLVVQVSYACVVPSLSIRDAVYNPLLWAISWSWRKYNIIAANCAGFPCHTVVLKKYFFSWVKYELRWKQRLYSGNLQMRRISVEFREPYVIKVWKLQEFLNVGTRGNFISCSMSCMWDKYHCVCLSSFK